MIQMSWFLHQIQVSHYLEWTNINEPSWSFYSHPVEKYAQVKLDHFSPNFEVEDTNYISQPPNLPTFFGGGW